VYVGSRADAFSPKRWWHARFVQESAKHGKDDTDVAFRLAVLVRGLGAGKLAYDPVVS
jgi:hypothetical protein